MDRHIHIDDLVQNSKVHSQRTGNGKCHHPNTPQQCNGECTNIFHRHSGHTMHITIGHNQIANTKMNRFHDRSKVIGVHTKFNVKYRR